MKGRPVLYIKGQSLVEIALVLPLLMLIMMGIFDLGRAVYYLSAISNAANEAARYGAIYHCDEGDIEAVARQFAIGLGDSLQFDGVYKDFIDIDGVKVPEYITVSLSYDFVPVTPLIGNFFGEDGAIHMQRGVIQRIEQQVSCGT